MKRPPCLYLETWVAAGRAVRHAQLVNRRQPHTRPREPGGVRGDAAGTFKGRFLARHAPHLLLWARTDQALLPVHLRRPGGVRAGLTVRRFADAGHWILHEKPTAVAEAIRTFLRG